MKIEQTYSVVPIDSVSPHPDNPRKGNVGVIEESINENDWYGAIVVQKSTGFIVAGNHRWLAAKARGATEIPAIFRDISDAKALRIMLVDNRSSDVATYDFELLDQLLRGLDSLEGTGFDELLSEVQLDDEAEEEEEPLEPADDDDWVQQWGIILVCKDEAEQQEIYEEAKDRWPDLGVRVVTV